MSNTSVEKNNTFISTKVQKYVAHEKATWKSAFLNFVVAEPKLSHRSFCNSGLCNIARKTFMDSWKKMPKLQELKDDATKMMTEKLDSAEPIINNFLSLFGESKCSRTKNAISAIRYLTDNEEQAIVWIAKIACAAGLGLTRDDLLTMINDYVNDGKEDDSAIQVTMEMVTRIIRKNENHLGAISASSLDPKQAKQANRTTRDVFLPNLMHILGCSMVMGKSHGSILKTFQMDVYIIWMRLLWILHNISRK